MSLKRTAFFFLFASVIIFSSAADYIFLSEAHAGELNIINVGIENCNVIYTEAINATDEYFTSYLSALYKIMRPNEQFDFNLIYGTRAEVLNMMENGEVDFGILETSWRLETGPIHSICEEISDRVDVISSEIAINRHVMYIDQGNSDLSYRNYEEFNSQRVGVYDVGCAEELVSEYEKINGVKFVAVDKYQDLNKLAEDLRADKIDIAVTNYYSDKFRKIVDYVGYIKMSIVVQKENNKLYDELDLAFSKLYLKNPGFRNDLEKVFQNNISYHALDKNSKEFIEKSDVLNIVCQKDWHPYEYYDEAENVYKGINIEILNRISADSGLKFNIIGKESYLEELESIENGEADVILSVYKNVKIDGLYNLELTEPYKKTNFYMIGKYGASTDVSRYVYSDKSVAYGMNKYLCSRFQEWIPIQLNDRENAFSEISKGEADFTVLEEEVAQYFIAENYHEDIGIIRTVASDIGMCIGVSKGNGLEYSAIVNIINQCIGAISGDELDAIIISNSAPSHGDVSIINLARRHKMLIMLLCFLLICVPAALIIINNVKNSASRYRDFLLGIISENVDTVVLIYDVVKEKMEYVFHNSQHILGLSALSIQRQPNLLFECCGDEIKDVFQAFKDKSINNEMERECSFVNPKTSEKIWIKLNVKPKMDVNGLNRYLFSISDLTNEKNSKQLLSNALNSAQQANLAKMEFLSHVSHEIRTPMNAIIGMTTIAEARIDEKDRVRDCLSKIAVSSNHLLSLINDILDMSKIDSGKMVLSSEPFVLPDLIENIVSIIMPQMQAKSINFNVEIKQLEHEHLIGDSMRLEQVILNVLSNAMKFTPEKGRVSIQFREAHKSHSDMVFLEIIVKDNGIGMSESFIKHIYEPFKQENRSDAPYNKGTGLGMSITYNIVSLMNGTIDINSKIGEGTEFKIKIMLSTDKTYSEINEKLENLKVLIVDDEVDVCENTSIYLENIGVESEWTLSGTDAIAKVVQAHEAMNDYDVAIIDWIMPDMDGIHTTREIRRCIGDEMPIIILSAYDWSEIEQEAYDAGVTAFISKPMFRTNLYYTLYNVTKKNKIEEPPIVKTKADFSGHHFLLVEDNELNQEIAQELLMETGAEVDVANNGVEAVDMFKKSTEFYYDVIFMDIQMPYMNGYEATGEIRALNRKDALNVPIFAMTANAFTSDVAESFISGMNGHISKPIDINKVYTELESVLLNSSKQS